jgi:hypothetical protein
MGPRSLLREAWEIVPVLLLLAVGGLIAIQSGIERPVTGTGFRHAVRNVSQVVLRVLGYVAVLLMLQYWVGMRPVLGW